MPELPEVETVKRGLLPFILNKKIMQTLPDGGKGFIGEVSEVDGATVIAIRRRGKALLIDLDNGRTLMIHLRMTGQLIWRGALLAESEDFAGASTNTGISTGAFRDTEASTEDFKDTEASAKIGGEQDAAHANFAAGHPSKNFVDALPNKQTRVTFEFADGKLFFNDQRKFGFVKVILTEEVENDKFIAELAKEPWEMTPAELFAKCQRHAKAPIKAVLLNQKIIAGLGNIYADESLFYASVHPSEPAGNLSQEQVAKLLEGACKIMQAAIDSGGSTMATYIRPDGTTGDYLEKFAQVFRRDGQPCPRCGELIVKSRVAGRGTHTCPKCQRLGQSHA